MCGGGHDLYWDGSLQGQAAPANRAWAAELYLDLQSPSFPTFVLERKLSAIVQNTSERLEQ